MNKKILNPNKKLQSYVIGLALGDGNLRNPNGRAVRLRITCDKKYPFLIQKIKNSIQNLLPSNKVSIVNRHQNYLDVSCFSNKWPEILGWQANKGPKFKQSVSIPKWIKQNKNYTINCLRGLLETDGTIYLDRGYKMAMFVTIIPTLAQNIYDAISSLNFQPRMYKIKTNKNILYHIRISKNVSKFLNLIKPEKI
jgi:DNA-binding transcriptional regulator WhiA